MQGIIRRGCLAVVLVLLGAAFGAAAGETFIGITGQRTARVGKVEYYSVSIVGIPGNGEMSLRLGSSPGGYAQGRPQRVVEGVSSWTGLFPVSFENIMPYPIELPIHATFTYVKDNVQQEIDSASFRVTVLPLRWGVVIREREGTSP